MKKIILVLFLFSSLIFGYEVARNGLYKFTNSELETLFGPNTGCQVAGMGVFNEGRVRYSLRGTSTHEEAFKKSGEFMEYVNEKIIRPAHWNKKKDYYSNLVGFYTEKCPKTYKKVAEKMLPKEDYQTMKKLNMIKIYNETTEYVNEYGKYYKEVCERYVVGTTSTTTYWDTRCGLKEIVEY